MYPGKNRMIRGNSTQRKVSSTSFVNGVVLLVVIFVLFNKNPFLLAVDLVSGVSLEKPISILISAIPGFTPIIQHASKLNQPITSISQEDQISHQAPASAVISAVQPNLNSSSPPPFASHWMIIKNQFVNVRELPSLTVPILKVAYKDESYLVLSEKGEWDQIYLTPSQTGWVLKKSILDQKMPLSKTSTMVQTVSAAPFYEGPGSDFEQLTHTNAGQLFAPLLVSGEFVQVEGRSGQKGWLPVNQVHWQESVKTQETDSLAVMAKLSKTKPVLPLLGKTLVIDPGHGGKDTGAIGSVLPIYERDVNLAVSFILEKKLQAAGAKVLLTRTSNDQFVTLDSRVQESNQTKADAFVSIHQNMFPADPSIHGTMTYYDSKGLSETLANDVEQKVNTELQVQKSADLRSGMVQEELYVLSHNKRPSILIEGCFLSNPKELSDSVTVSYEENLAEGIYQGLLKYFHNL